MAAGAVSWEQGGLESRGEGCFGTGNQLEGGCPCCKEQARMEVRSEHRIIAIF